MKQQQLIELLFNLSEDSEYFLNEARRTDPSDSKSEQRFIRASMLAAWATFEGWINKTAFDFQKTIKDLSTLDRAILLEKRIELRDGAFVVSNTDKFESIENKILYLLQNFAHYSLDKSTIQWKNFKTVKKIRDSVVHPKVANPAKFSISDAELTVRTLKHFQNLLLKKLYK